MQAGPPPLPVETGWERRAGAVEADADAPSAAGEMNPSAADTPPPRAHSGGGDHHRQAPTPAPSAAPTSSQLPTATPVPEGNERSNPTPIHLDRALSPVLRVP